MTLIFNKQQRRYHMGSAILLLNSVCGCRDWRVLQIFKINCSSLKIEQNSLNEIGQKNFV